MTKPVETGLFDGILKFFGQLLQSLVGGARDDEAPNHFTSAEFSSASKAATRLAENYVGRKESGGQNRGDIVRDVGGIQGLGWCGAFVNHVMDQAFGKGLFDQKDYLMARSYMREGQEYDVFHKGMSYMPKVSDVIVTGRGNSNVTGHVGIVTKVDGDNITYIDGNSGNAVREHTFNRNNPPKNLLGFTDTQALALAKGIIADPSGSTYIAHNGKSNSAATSRHS